MSTPEIVALQTKNSEHIEDLYKFKKDVLLALKIIGATITILITVCTIVWSTAKWVGKTDTYGTDLIALEKHIDAQFKATSDSINSMKYHQAVNQEKNDGNFLGIHQQLDQHTFLIKTFSNSLKAIDTKCDRYFSIGFSIEKVKKPGADPTFNKAQ